MSIQTAAAPRAKRRFWRQIARFAVISMVMGLVLLSVGTFGFITSFIHPPRMPVTHSPAEWGIVTYEDAAFATTDGVILRGWFLPSQNGAVVILGHGHATNREGMLPFASMLARYGYGVLLFDWRAHGASDGDKATLGNAEVLDFQAAFNYVASRPDVDAERIGVLGISMGASIMIEGAARDPRVKAVVVEAPYTSLESVTGHRLAAVSVMVPLVIAMGQIQTGGDVDLVRPVDEICAISPNPVLMIFGEHDNLLAPETAADMFAAACDPKELWIVPGGGHVDTLSLVPAEYEQRVITFFNNALGN
jgi:uncharacterized protein